MKLEQLGMTVFGLPERETVQTWTDRESKPFDMDAWHASVDGQWLPDVQGPQLPAQPTQ